jgi:hypothetical protein
VRARYKPDGGFIVVSLDQYPSTKVGEVLNGFSLERKCICFPSNLDPSSDWKWRIDGSYLPALIWVFKYFSIALEAHDD